MTKILSLIVGKLRREPVAVWGVVVAAVLGALTAAGVSSAIVESITAALTLLGIPVVRSAVTPVTALKALLTSTLPAPVAPVASANVTVVKDAGHSEIDTVLLVVGVVGVFLLLFGVTLR